MDLFVELIQVALGSRERLSYVPTTREWAMMLCEAKKQAIVGVLLDGLERLPIDQCPPKELLLKWIGLTQVIESQNRQHQSVLIKTCHCLQQGGVPVAYMKGLICGSRYNMPLRRQCGDIDFAVRESDFPLTLDLLDTIACVDRNLIHEHHGMAFVDDVILEPHYKVHNFQNPSTNDTMKRLFAEVFPCSLTTLSIGGEFVPVFPPAFECVVLVGHMVNHVYAEGLGLRQVMDFRMFLGREYKTVMMPDCLRFLKMMKMDRAFRVFSRVCEFYLGMPDTLLKLRYSSAEKKFASKLMQDILHVGNFAQGVDYLGDNKTNTPVRSYLWVVGRCVRLGYLCPSEARWWPVSKLKRFLWKTANNWQYTTIFP